MKSLESKLQTYQALLDPCVTPTVEAPADSAEPGGGSSWLRREETGVRFRGHQAEVAMITITACSYLTLVDPQQHQKHPEVVQQEVG